MKPGWTYIMTNKSCTVLYTGVTSNICKRFLEHKNKMNPKSFTSRYNINKLVFYQYFDDIRDAIEYEYLIKKKKRINKIKLIEEMNPNWIDLMPEMVL